MKFYIASRFALRDEVKHMYDTLKNMGHEISHDWTDDKNIKPYEHNSEAAKIAADRDMQGVHECDVFILISDIEGTGMYAELGGAIMRNIQSGTPHIYIIGDYKDSSMFNYHPSVVWKEDFDEVLAHLKMS